METAKGTLAEVITIRLEPDSDVLKGIEEACRKYDLKNGVIISGLGSLRRAEYFNPLSFPDGRVAYGDPIIREEILELVSISGIVCHDEDGTISPHVHVTLSRKRRQHRRRAPGLRLPGPGDHGPGPRPHRAGGHVPQDGPEDEGACVPPDPALIPRKNGAPL